MIRADELYNEVTNDASGKGASQGMFIGCFVDAATGYVTFTCEGKETSHRFKVYRKHRSCYRWYSLYYLLKQINSFFTVIWCM